MAFHGPPSARRFLDDNGVGDGLVTASISYGGALQDGNQTYRRAYGHDWRNRRIATLAPGGLLQLARYDHLDRIVATGQFTRQRIDRLPPLTGLGSSMYGDPDLIAMTASHHDVWGQITGGMWKRHRSRTGLVAAARSSPELVRQPRSGDQRPHPPDVCSQEYPLQRPQLDEAAHYVGVDGAEADSDYLAACDIAGDSVIEQTIPVYDLHGRPHRQYGIHAAGGAGV